VANRSWYSTSLGAQNDLKYAVFPRLLVIEEGDRVEIYDTGNHRSFGVAQTQSSDQTLTFTSQDGLVRVKDFPKVAMQEFSGQTLRHGDPCLWGLDSSFASAIGDQRDVEIPVNCFLACFATSQPSMRALARNNLCPFTLLKAG